MVHIIICGLEMDKGHFQEEGRCFYRHFNSIRIGRNSKTTKTTTWLGSWEGSCPFVVAS